MWLIGFWRKINDCYYPWHSNNKDTTSSKYLVSNDLVPDTFLSIVCAFTQSCSNIQLSLTSDAFWQAALSPWRDSPPFSTWRISMSPSQHNQASFTLWGFAWGFVRYSEKPLFCDLILFNLFIFFLFTFCWSYFVPEVDYVLLREKYSFSLFCIPSTKYSA